MKKSFLHSVILLLTVVSVRAYGQAQQVMPYNEAKFKNIQQTVLTGNWEIRNGQNGSVCIFDANKHMVRNVVINNIQASRTDIGFQLFMDDCGNLHIINSTKESAPSVAYSILAKGQVSDDPDFTPEVHTLADNTK